MESPGIILAFWVLSAVTVAGCLMVLISRNLLHALVFLVLAFLGMAGLFVTLSADFIAVAQILIYAGSIAVLMVFAIMLTPLAARDNANSLYVRPARAAGLGVAAIIGFVAVTTPWGELTGDALAANDPVTTVAAIGDLLLGRYVLPFEVASVLLFFALIGAIVLVHDRRGEREAGEAS